MATLTASSVVEHSFGDVAGYSADFTSVSDGDTFDVKAKFGFGLLFNALFTPTTAVVVTPTFGSTSTITFKVAAGTVAGRLTVWGK